MKLSDDYIIKYSYNDFCEIYCIPVDRLEDLFVIKDLENYLSQNWKSSLWYHCEEQLKQIAVKHDLPYD